MTEDTTQDMPDARSFEERIFARFDAIDARFNVIGERFDHIENRLTNLEERVDRRLQETRPIWEAVQAQLKQMNKKLDVIVLDIYEMRTEIKTLDDRVTDIENRRAQ